jgi:hypothetical protein
VTSNGKVFMHQFHFAGVFLEQLLKLRSKLRTVPSFIIAEDRDDDRCIFSACKR